MEAGGNVYPLYLITRPLSRKKTSRFANCLFQKSFRFWFLRLLPCPRARRVALFVFVMFGSRFYLGSLLLVPPEQPGEEPARPLQRFDPLQQFAVHFPH